MTKKTLVIVVSLVVILSGVSVAGVLYLWYGGVVDESIDTDWDGMPDFWEKSYGLNPLNASDWILDLDRDGLVNRDEYELSGNPLEKDLFIEVDYLEGYNSSLVRQALDNLTIYYEEHGIHVHVEYNTPNHVISGYSNGKISEVEHGVIELEYHDFKNTHVYLLLAGENEDHPNWCGWAYANYGGAIALHKAGDSYDAVEYQVMHEIGHCLGIGLHDDDDGEVYCLESDCWMRWSGAGSTKYCDDCWDDMFAPDGEFGSSKWSSARIWNKFSVNEELSYMAIFDSETIWADSTFLHDVAIGDFNLLHPGNEVVVVGESFNATIITGSRGNWSATTMWSAGMNLYGVAVGDVDLSHDGEEVVVVSVDGYAYMLTGSGSDWNVTKINDVTSGTLWDVAIGDFDWLHPGNEIVVAGCDVYMVSHGENNWSTVLMHHDSKLQLECVSIGDFDSSHEGNEVVVVGFDHESGKSKAIMIVGSESDWNATTIWECSGFLLGVAVGDFDPSNIGGEVIAVSEPGDVTMLTGSGSNWTAKTIWTDYESLYGVTVGDFDPSIVGDEIIVVGYSKRVTMLYSNSGNYTSKTVYAGDMSLMSVTVGDIDPFSIGNEVVAVSGYAFSSKGDVILIHKKLDTDGDLIPDIDDAEDDNDFMPDFWEEQYRLNKTDPSDADQDDDGDGYSNLQEYKAGTNPLDRSSHPIGFDRWWWVIPLVVGIVVATTVVMFLKRKREKGS